MAYTEIWKDLMEATANAKGALIALVERGNRLEELESKSEVLTEQSQNWKETVSPPSIPVRAWRKAVGFFHLFLSLFGFVWGWCSTTVLCRMIRGEFDKESPLNRESQRVKVPFHNQIKAHSV